MKSKIKKFKGAVAIGLALFVATAGIVQSLTDDDSPNALPEPVLTVETQALPPEAEFVPAETPEEEIKKIKAKKGESMLSLYIHTIGYALSTALNVALKTLVTPVMGKLLFWVCIAIVTIAALVIGLKAAFPDIPFKELLNPKRIALAVLGVVAACAVCEFLPAYISEIDEWMLYIRFGVTLLITFVLTQMAEKAIIKPR